jgi:hypothetical protein
MSNFLALLHGAAVLLAGCQQSPSTSAASAPAATLPAATLQTAADARAAVGRYLQSQPNAALYVLDSARVNDNEATWQVLVPRTDWAKRMPNSARFEVEKTTGAVRTGTVK